MKDEPWRGNPEAWEEHLEDKLRKKKARITHLEGLYNEVRVERTQLRAEVAALRERLAEWEDPDSPRRQALLEEIVHDVGDGQRSEVDLRESQLAAAEAARDAALAQKEGAEKEAEDRVAAYQDVLRVIDRARLSAVEEAAAAREEAERKDAEWRERAAVLAWETHTEGRVYALQHGKQGMSREDNARVSARIDSALAPREDGTGEEGRDGAQ